MKDYARYLSKGGPKILRVYKPLDEKLRKISLYQKMSTALHRAYHKSVEPFMGTDEYYAKYFDLLPVENNLIIFESFWGRKIACNPYAVYREVVNDPRMQSYKIIWVKNEGVEAPEDVTKNKNVTFISYQSVDYAKALLRAKYLISNSTFPAYFIRKPEQEYVNVWHGIPVKHMGLDSDPAISAAANTQRNFLQASKILLSSEYAIDKTVAPYGASSLTRPKAKVIGSPRIDFTLNTDCRAVKAKLGVKEDKKVILYAPTWRGRVSSVSGDVNQQLAVIQELQDRFGEEYHLLLSIHNYTRSKMESVPEGVTLVPDEVDINVILAGVDILITDYSSIMVDFLALNRPLVLFVPDRIEYEEERGLYISLDELPATLVYSLKNLGRAISDSRKPSSFESWQNVKSLLLPAEDGGASRRVVDEVWFPEAMSEGQKKLKKRIFIHPGTFMPNGITASCLNLLSNIDYEKYDVYVMVDTSLVGRDDARMRCVNQIDPRCQLVLRRPKFVLSAEENTIYKLFGDGVALSATETKILKCAFAREVKRVVGEHKFDVAIDFSGYSHFWSLFIANMSAKHHVIYQHSDLFSEANNNKGYKIKYDKQLKQVFNCYKFFDDVVSVSQQVGQVNYENLNGYYSKRARVSVVRNSLNLKKIRHKATAPVSLISPKFAMISSENGPVKFVSIGRLSPEKNQSRLLKAFSKVIKEGVNAVLFLVGEGPLREALEAESQKLQIEDRVVFTGWVSNPYPLLAASDCMVLSSDYEGQPMTLLEALSLGIPCIGTNIPGIRSVLGNGGGVLTDQNDASLAEAMIKFSESNQDSKIDFNGETYVDMVMKDFYQSLIPISEKVSSKDDMMLSDV
ncbi:CDP-glycerol glycerophosphotransferase family protein [Microbulbifer sp. JMSA002]|uniref:CDP-glycerol glycerophosphotransferase family protein n=1 Tax=Microbulbifer sp. JMSA002 TaxID=3243368 RepID=UPI00403A6D7F